MLPSTRLSVVPLPSIATPAKVLPEMTLLASITFADAPEEITTPKLLANESLPAWFVPMKLPCTQLSVVSRPRMRTPLLALPEITFCAVESVPPMVLFDASARIATPVELGRDFSPVTSVPMKLPSTSLFIVPASLIATPAPLFPEMTLPADGSVRPMVLFDAPFTIVTPAALARGVLPVTSVPIRLPSTRLFIVPVSLIRITVATVPGNEVARLVSDPADHVMGCTARDLHAIALPEGSGAVQVGADIVALDAVGHRRGTGDRYTEAFRLSFDEVAGPIRRPADDIPRAPRDLHAVADAEKSGAVQVGADEVALDPVVQRIEIADIDTDTATGDEVAGVRRRLAEEAAHPGRDDVARPWCASADQVGERVGGDGNADRVRQRLGAGDVGADEVALHHVTRPAGAGPENG